MRFLLWLVSGALFLLFIYLIASWFVDGYFGGNIFPDSWERDSWAAPDSWSEWRDIVIVLSAGFFVLAGMLSVVLVVALIFLVFMARRVLKENAAPALDSLRQSVDNIRGTTEFAGETVASPIIRVYAVVKGVRSGLGAITSLPDRVKGRRKKK
ncbi:MAG TPA: hypothetical protein PKD27_01975 [Tepidiformaceae bacterium]|nr:hypothetical protein [Tepidiformaceae bacterium]